MKAEEQVRVVVRLYPRSFELGVYLGIAIGASLVPVVRTIIGLIVLVIKWLNGDF